MHLFLLALLGAAAPFSAAQATFYSMNWGQGFVQNQTYAITWSSLDTGPVSANLQSGNYSQPIFTNLIEQSVDGYYTWTVPIIIPGIYTMQLLDNGVQSDESPTFHIYALNNNMTSTGSISITTMSITTLSSMAAASSTGAAMSATTYTYWDTRCTCTKTAMAPAPTTPTGSMNYTVPAMPTPTISMTPFVGSAARFPGLRSSIGFLGAIAVLGVALLA